MATLSNNSGARSWSATRDAEGHREYKIKWLVELADGEGPKAALDCPGLPVVGSTWQYGNDVDPWATCLPTATVSPGPNTREGDPYNFVQVEQTFSTKPPDPSKGRCNDTPVEDPLLEPQKLSGSFTRYEEEATTDRYGKPIRTSSHELVRGKQVEFDKNRGTVKVEQNVPLLGAELFGPMIDTLNDRPLWGYPARFWKLSTTQWERKFYQRCRIYFTRTFTFELSIHIDELGSASSGWDRDLLDEGSKVLNGHWGVVARGELDHTWYVDRINGSIPDPRNPLHFIKAKDTQGNPMKMVLNGSGLPGGISVVGIPVTVVASVGVSAHQVYDVIGQPVNPSKLLLEVVDGANGITECLITIHGTDTADLPIQEFIDISDSGTMNYITQNTYKTVTQVSRGQLTQTGPDVQTLSVITDVSELLAGNIHVEKYTESNFYLLGIPIDFLH